LTANILERCHLNPAYDGSRHHRLHRSKLVGQETMIVLAIIATIAAAGLSVMTIYANGMRSSPGEFQGGSLIVIGWLVAFIMWLAWWFS
jgi:uncharacterized membrane protein